jgi:hypothetical protein
MAYRACVRTASVDTKVRRSPTAERVCGLTSFTDLARYGRQEEREVFYRFAMQVTYELTRGIVKRWSWEAWQLAGLLYMLVRMVLLYSLQACLIWTLCDKS